MGTEFPGGDRISEAVRRIKKEASSTEGGETI